MNRSTLPTRLGSHDLAEIRTLMKGLVLEYRIGTFVKNYLLKGRIEAEFPKISPSVGGRASIDFRFLSCLNCPLLKGILATAEKVG